LPVTPDVNLFPRCIENRNAFESTPYQAAAAISRAMVEVGGGPFGPLLQLSGEVPASPFPVNNIRFFRRST
jgi:hypothetical protein